MRYLETYPGTVPCLGLRLGHMGEVEYAADEPLEAHVHTHFEFDLLVAGVAEYVVGDQRYVAEAGTLCTARPGDRHSMGPMGGPWRYLFFHMDEPADFELCQYLSNSATRVHPGRRDLEASFRRVLGEVGSERPGATHVAHATVVGILVDLVRQSGGATRPRAPRWASGPVSHANWFIATRGLYSTAVREIADSAGVSVSRISHLFAEEIGKPPRECLRQVLAERARRLLESGGHTTGQIAQRLGFPDTPTFSKFFRAQVGCSPSEYRSRQRPEPPPALRR